MVPGVGLIASKGQDGPSHSVGLAAELMFLTTLTYTFLIRELGGERCMVGKQEDASGRRETV